MTEVPVDNRRRLEGILPIESYGGRKTIAIVESYDVVTRTKTHIYLDRKYETSYINKTDFLTRARDENGNYPNYDVEGALAMEELAKTNNLIGILYHRFCEWRTEDEAKATKKPPMAKKVKAK